jgi:subtilase family serine protease
MKLPVDRTKALHKIINTYLNYAKNRNVNSELLPYISLERVRINNNKCILNIKLLLNDGASLSSYTEDRTLIMLLTTIKSYMKNLKYFKIYGLENDFKHIDTRFPFTLNDQNLVIVGD